jgi:putative two-component system response regulator
MTSPVRLGTDVSIPTPRRSHAATQFAESASKRLLVVDDEESIRTVLGRFLRARGYEVVTADSAAAALDILGSHRFLLALCDIRMPGMTGLELLPRARSVDPDLAVVMLTAVNDAPTATEALTHGALDYLMKPIELTDLESAVQRALHKRDLLIQQRAVERKIREEVVLRTAELEQEKAALRNLTVSVAETLINAMEAKDIYLLGHSQRVAELASSIATQLELSEDTVEQIRIAGRLHDVGKIGIRESVLNKPGSLTAEEFEHIKDHIRIGMEILAPLSHLGMALQYVQDHHEHWDGTGYPQGLTGTDISIGGRILAAADAFDALTSRRAYREPMSPEDTVEFLSKHVGRLLDPDVFAAMRTVVSRKRTLVFIDPHL